MKHRRYCFCNTVIINPFIIILLATYLVGCESLSEIPENAISVGVMLPFTGKDAAIGTNYEHALLMVEKEVNASGGINGRPVAFLVRDTHSSTEGAANALADLIKNNVVALIGPEDTEIVRELLPELEAAGIPLLSPVISGGDSIALTNDYRWFRLAPSASIMGRSFANRLWSDGIKDLTIVYSSGDYHLDFVGAFSDRYTFLGGDITGRT
ncbi:MAG: amino acid ABC transporter substrate-binding protein, partial [Deltaproteobacteria bacterium]|nr:amino acid ABC transporter substrate-binding protein [Deltaproteobacteria bacterium]